MAAGKRPPHVRPPAHWGPSPPVPDPQPAPAQDDPEGALSPTRYGDWEKKGVAVDF